MARTAIDFGIDLGTTNSTIAVMDGVDAKVIPNKGGSVVTPSSVWIDKRGSVHVGQEAKLRALGQDQDNADVEFKLRMGLGDEGKKVFSHSGREMSPEELSAEVLKSLKTDVRASSGEDVRACVITVPAAFENPSTNATMKAAKLAGFESSPLLLEPVAAALAYGFQNESENEYWFTYDFGGGTFDAAVVRIRDGLIQVVNHDGDNFLGGKLIDWDIVTKKLIPAITAEYNLPDFKRGNVRWQREIGMMKYHSEIAKIEVCRSKQPHELWIEGLCQDADGKVVDFAYTLTPEDMLDVSTPYIERSLALCRKTLAASGLTGADMQRILMVGGTTLNPWVRDAVTAELGSQVVFDIDPITVVARGAAIFASTQPWDWEDSTVAVPAGTWRVEVEHEPVGNIPDPDIGGRVIPGDGASTDGVTIEFVDTKTNWRSGRLPLDSDGVFFTQLSAPSFGKYEFEIEVIDAQDKRLQIQPDKVPYTLGVLPEATPPAAMSIGIGLANGRVASYIKKGAKLPARKSIDHYTTIPLKAGEANDVLRIPLLEGEHARASRNHGIGAMTVSGADIARDLPVGSVIEITLIMDASQQVRLQAYIQSLDEDFEMAFDPQMAHSSLDELKEELSRQRERLAKAREDSESTGAPKAREALVRIETQQLFIQVDALIDAAGSDRDAVAQADRLIREIGSTIDEAEDATAWPELLKEAEKSQGLARDVVDEYGEAKDGDRLRIIEDEIRRAIDAQDPDLLQRSLDDLTRLRLTILDRQPAMHIARLNWLTEKVDSMRDPVQAKQIIAQGNRAISNNDIDALKAANRQLVSLLPSQDQALADDPNSGGTDVMG